jgi:N-acetylmuramic acid 6-phosphate etherase
MSDILTILHLAPSAQSEDYIRNKRQFHLYGLLTEQRHPKTWNLSFAVQADTQAGLNLLLAVDRDIFGRLRDLAEEPSLLDQAAQAITEAAGQGRKIYFYGCGATGRLAKQMESTFWRPFWRRVRRHPLWAGLQRRLPHDIGELVAGEMTGADRALVSSLEGFEDLQLIGRLQLEDHEIRAGDVVICVTEGGETSSVIGTVLAALNQYGELDSRRLVEAHRHLYFVYNNPDEVLRPFERSAAVLDQPAITRVNLTTGPQAITGSTRMQATTIETFVLGAVLEEAAYRILRRHLRAEELRELGYSQDLDLSARLSAFGEIKAAVDSSVGSLAQLTDTEARTYRWTGRVRRAGNAGCRFGRRRITQRRPGSVSWDADSAGWRRSDIEPRSKGK